VSNWKKNFSFMVTIKKKFKNINYSYVIGRFSPEIGSKFQHFPISSWEKDLQFAKKFKFDGTEWIISDFSNPIFNENFRKIIKKKLRQNKLKICSISLDLIMDNPLHLINKQDVTWLANQLKKIIKFFHVKRVSIPIEERSRFNNYIEKVNSLRNLKLFYKNISNITNLCVETDLSPYNLSKLLKLRKFKKLGVLLDIGNTKAHGFPVENFFHLFSTKIFGIHVKYRNSFFSKTSHIKKGFSELKFVIKNIDKLENCQDITFQTFKSKNKFIKDMSISLSNFNNYV
tara:strand:+ start:9409 stop:10266 length:858 start_codon:yes stop_codon:yes gene_type:complete